jgi:hypothetical protein
VIDIAGVETRICGHDAMNLAPESLAVFEPDTLIGCEIVGIQPTGTHADHDGTYQSRYERTRVQQ